MNPKITALLKAIQDTKKIIATTQGDESIPLEIKQQKLKEMRRCLEEIQVVAQMHLEAELQEMAKEAA